MRPGICQNQPSACLRNCREPHRHLLHGGALSRRSSRDMLPYHRLGLGAMVGRVHDKPSQCAGSHTIPSSSARSRYSSSLFPSAQGVLFKVPRGPFSCCRYQRDRLRAPAIKLARARPRPPVVHVRLLTERLALVNRQHDHARHELERLVHQLADAAPADDANASPEERVIVGLRLAGRGEKIHEMVCRCGGRVPIREVCRARSTTATIRTDLGVSGTLGTCGASNASNETRRS